MKVALVTGAATGIGCAVADRLATLGWDVARNHLPGQLVSGYSAPADVADPEAVKAMVARIAADLGPVSLLVNNAAIGDMGAVDEMPIEAFWRSIDVNLGGSFYCTQACVPMMQAGNWGRIISMSSRWGQIGWPKATAYSASKAGIITLTKSLARTLGASGITVNAIAPGLVDTDMLEVSAAIEEISLADLKARAVDQIPLGRLGRPEDVAALVEFLASDAADSLTGQILAPNGGLTRW